MPSFRRASSGMRTRLSGGRLPRATRAMGAHGRVVRFRWSRSAVSPRAPSRSSPRQGTELFHGRHRAISGSRSAPAGTRLGAPEIVREVTSDPRKGRRPVHDAANIRQPVDYCQRLCVFNSGPPRACSSRAREGRAGAGSPGARTGPPRSAPGVHFSFEAGDIVSQVLNFGAPAHQVSVSGKRSRRRATRGGLALARSPSCGMCTSPRARLPDLGPDRSRARAARLDG